MNIIAFIGIVSLILWVVAHEGGAVDMLKQQKWQRIAETPLTPKEQADIRKEIEEAV